MRISAWGQRAWAWGIALLLTFGMTAYAQTQDGGQGGDATPTPTPTPKPDPDKPQLKLGKQHIEVLDAGAEEKRELRYALEVGSVMRLRHTHEATFSQLIQGVDNKNTISATVEVDVRVVEARESGYAIEVTVMKVKVGDSDMAWMAHGHLRNIVGETLTFSVNDRGVIDPASFAGPIANRPDAVTYLPQPQRLFVPLPAEPIGVGARWTVGQSSGGLGFEEAHTYTIELKAMSEQGFVVGATLDQAADPQPIDSPTAQGISLGRYKGTGVVAIERSLNDQGPASDKAELEVRLELLVQGGRMVINQTRTFETKTEHVVQGESPTDGEQGGGDGEADGDAGTTPDEASP